MYRNLALLVAILSLSLTPPLEASQPSVATQWTRSLPSIPSRYAGPQALTPIPLQVLDPNPAAVRLSLGEIDIDVSSVTLDDTHYSAVRMNGEAVDEMPGAPEVPRIVRMIMVENTGQYSLTITNSSYATGSLPYPPAPHVPLAEGENVLDGDDVLVLPEYYEANEWYPPQVATISEPATLRDVRFVLVTFYPVQVNAVTREVRTYDNIEVAIENQGGEGVNEISHHPEFVSPSFKELYRTFPNFAGSALDELPVLPGKHLYICDPDAGVVSEVQNLVTWRRKRGIDAYIRTTTDIGGALALDIRNFVISEYNNSNGALEYVTLVGDPNAGSPYMIVTGSSLDNYFATMSGGNPDPVPDVAVGRLPSQNLTQLHAMVLAAINYESNPFMTDTGWYRRAWCAAHTSSVPSNPSTKQYMRQIMLQHGVPTVDFDIFNSHITTSTMESRLEAGVCVFNDRMSWWNEFISSDLAGLNVGSRLPYVWVVTCATGTFDDVVYGDALNEDFVRPGGTRPVNAIGCVGMSGTGTHSRYNNILDGGGMQTLFVSDIREAGMPVIGAKLELYRNYWTVAGGGEQSYVTNFSAWCNLQGDPAVPVYLDIPQQLTVTHPASIARGTNNVSITVTDGSSPIANALVGLTKGSETFARGYTNASGQINLAVATPTTGTMDIVVTGKDLRPYISTISVVDVPASLSFSSVSVSDAGGTPDGILNPGETVNLNLILQNTGTSSQVTNILNATLTSTSPGITFSDAVNDYPNIPVGGTASPLLPFQFVVSQVFNSEPVTFFLNTSSSAGNQTIRFDLTPQAASVAYVSSSFPDANSRLDPGETGNFTVTVSNDGSRVFSSANGILRSLSTYVTVNDDAGAYGNIAIGGSATNSVNMFSVSAATFTPGGFQAPMQIVLTDGNGVRDSTNFLLTVGASAATSPTGPDAYGYKAYENSDTQPPGAAPTYEWIEICPALGGSGQSLGFTDGGEDQDDIGEVLLPFNAVFYGQSFDRITVSSNGWIAFGSTTQIDYRNWRMGSPLGPPNMVSAYWDDLLTTGIASGGAYVKDDGVNGRFIVEWITRCRNSTAQQVFQIVLYSPSVQPSPTGDSKILVQYQDVNVDPNIDGADNDYATVGIQNASHSIGLEICYWNMYTPGSTTLVDGRAIMFTTDVTGSINPHFSLLSPNGGELWLADSTETIAWSPGLVTGNVSISLSRTGAGGPWETLTASTPNDGSYQHVVALPASPNCRIRIQSNNSPDSVDVSASNFSTVQVGPILTENFESGAVGWSHSSPGGLWLDQWHVSTERALSGTHSYKCGDTGTGNYIDSLDAFLISPMISNLPAASFLEFWHQISSELSGTYPDSAFDGGMLEISLNGGAYQELVATGGYPKHFRYRAGNNENYTGPAVGGRACYAGTISNWTNQSVNLAPYAGQSIQLRWRFCSDRATQLEGWYVDDVSLYGAEAIPPPTAPQNVVINRSGDNLILRWQDDNNLWYQVFSAASPTGPFDTFVTQTQDTSITVAVPGDDKRFYQVVGWNGQ